MAPVNPFGVLSNKPNSAQNRRVRPSILSRKRKAEDSPEQSQPVPPQPSCSPSVDILCYEEIEELENAQGMNENHAPNYQEPVRQQPVRQSLGESLPSRQHERIPLAILSSSSKGNPVVNVTSSIKTKKIKMRKSWSQFREFIRSSSSQSPRSGSPNASLLRPADTSFSGERGPAPFPSLKWADRDEMWRLICKKETGMYMRKSADEICAQNPALQPRMRAILLDWLIEVCEVYRMHRETFYLAVDFIDRYISSTKDMPKIRLQLIGVTCLFIGSKIEEIYPPKLSEFAYVTDGACSEEEILSMELVILKHLNWGVSPMTPNSWMKMFMQLSNCSTTSDSESFVIPQYSGLPFARAMQLLDLCVLDMGSLSFRYSVLATAALAHMLDSGVALRASGYNWREVGACFDWMSAFVTALREENVPPIKAIHNIPAENAHNIQVHTIDINVLYKVQEYMAEMKSRKSPEPSQSAILLKEVLLTPTEDENDVSTSESNLVKHMQLMQKQQQRTPKSKVISGLENNSVFLSPQTPSTSASTNYIMH